MARKRDNRAVNNSVEDGKLSSIGSVGAVTLGNINAGGNSGDGRGLAHSNHRGGAGKSKNTPYKKKQKGKHRFGNRFKKHNRRQNSKPKCWIEDFKRSPHPEKGQLKGGVKIVITRAELDDNFEYAIKSHPLSDLNDKKKEEKKVNTVVNDERTHDGPTEHCADVQEICLDENKKHIDENLEKCPFVERTKIEEISKPPKKQKIESSNKKEPESVDGAYEIPILCTDITSDQKEDKRQAFIQVLRSPGAQGKTKWLLKQTKHNNSKIVHLPNGDCGDGILNPHPKSKVADKYWAQRKRLFRRYDEGIQLDEESWYSVTPEIIADHIAMRMEQFMIQRRITDNIDASAGCIVFDAFCGCGGNAIAFAKRPRNQISLVIAIDKDREKLRMAANNARIYGIPPDKIIFIEADAIHVMKKCYVAGKLTVGKGCCSKANFNEDSSMQTNERTNLPSTEICHGFKIGGMHILPSTIDVIFLSPPWGGPSYIELGTSGFDIVPHIQIQSDICQKDDGPTIELDESDISGVSGEVKNIGTKENIDGEMLLKIATEASRQQNVVFFLPRNINGISLGRSALKAEYKGIFEMEQNVMNGKTKTVTTYFGNSCAKLLASLDKK